MEQKRLYGKSNKSTNKWSDRWGGDGVMLRDLVEQDLYFTYYNSEDGTYDLEFKVKNKTILVRGVKI